MQSEKLALGLRKICSKQNRKQVENVVNHAHNLAKILFYTVCKSDVMSCHFQFVFLFVFQFLAIALCS